MAQRTRGVGAQHEHRRREIADAVLAIVAEHGLAAVSLNEVAARAGVSAGRVQHYYPAKDGLITAAFHRANQLSETRIARRVGQDLADANPRTVLTVVLTELIPYDVPTRTHLRVRQSFAALALASAPIAEGLRGDYTRLHGDIADLLRRDRACGRIGPGVDPHAEAVRLVALAEGLAYYVLIDLTPAEDARGAVLDAIATLYPPVTSC